MAYVSGQDWEVNFNYRDSASGTFAQNAIAVHTGVGVLPSALSDDVQTAWGAGQIDWVAGTASIQSVTIKDLAKVIATAEFATDGSAKWTGGGLGQSLVQVAGIVRLQSLFTGRSHRGRIYIPFIGEGETDAGGLIDVVAVAAGWLAFGEALLASASEGQVSINSRKLLELTPVAAYTPQTIVGTQRRRVARLR